MLSDIRYSKVWQVYCSVDKGSAGFNGFGFLVPSHEGKMLLGAVHISSLFPEKSPENKDLFVLFCEGTRQHPYAYDIQRSVAEFSAILKIQGQPQVLHVQEWEKAIPQFNVGFGAIRERIKLFESTHPNLYVAGNYVSGVAVGDCVKLANELANQLTPA
jgi:oxygen-dependent protoporphyrinogen oxidase